MASPFEKCANALCRSPSPRERRVLSQAAENVLAEAVADALAAVGDEAAEVRGVDTGGRPSAVARAGGGAGTVADAGAETAEVIEDEVWILADG